MQNQDLLELPENPNDLRIYNIDPSTRMQQIIDRQNDLINADNGVLDEDQQFEFDQLAAEFARLEKMGMGRQAEPMQPANSAYAGPHHVTNRPITGGDPAGSSHGTNGFRTYGEFFSAIAKAGNPHLGASGIDPRLVMNAPGMYSSEGVGADGGFSVPPEFKNQIWMKMLGEESLLGRCDQTFTPSNTVEVPADETPIWSTTDGPLVSWNSEGGQLTQSKVKLASKTIRLGKANVLIPVTSELLEDAPGLDAYLRKKVGSLLDFAVSLQILQGPGAGKPLGILNSPSIVSVPKESGQAADTIVFRNLKNMWSRLFGPCHRNAVWLVHPSVLPALVETYFPLVEYGTPATNGAVVAPRPVYIPDAIAGAPFGTIFGKPVIPTQACSLLGDKGDIILADLSQYWVAMKSTGIRADISLHLFFDYDIACYRFILRLMGQPWWASSLAQRVGSDNLSWAVTLDERA